MITELDLVEFKNKLVFNKRRKFLFNRFLDEYEIIQRNCYAYQILFIGSYIGDKDGLKLKPGDIDIYIRAFTRPSHAEFLPKHLKKRVPILPFCDYDNFTDILPLEPFVTNEPTYLSAEEMIEIFNKINKFNVDSAIVVSQFQKTPVITHINTIDRDGNPHEFIVNEESFIHKEIKGTIYRISVETEPSWMFFEFKVLDITEDRTLIYMINNNHTPVVSGKGIVKSMIKALSSTYRKNIVSSTNTEELKLDNTEGRIDIVSDFWNKWMREMDNVDYIKEEDRFIFRPA